VIAARPAPSSGQFQSGMLIRTRMSCSHIVASNSPVCVAAWVRRRGSMPRAVRSFTFAEVDASRNGPYYGSAPRIPDFFGSSVRSGAVIRTGRRQLAPPARKRRACGCQSDGPSRCNQAFRPLRTHGSTVSGRSDPRAIESRE
jgi:hypothetical protein